MNRELRPACMVGPYDVIEGERRSGPWSPVTVLVPDLADALANLHAAGLNPTVIAIAIAHEPSTEGNPW